MKLPKRLEEKRDALAKVEFQKAIFSDMNEGPQGAHFKNGFNACAQAILESEEHKELVEALEKMTSVERMCKAGFSNHRFEDAYRVLAEGALESWRKFMGETE